MPFLPAANDSNVATFLGNIKIEIEHTELAHAFIYISSVWKIQKTLYSDVTFNFHYKSYSLHELNIVVFTGNQRGSFKVIQSYCLYLLQIFLINWSVSSVWLDIYQICQEKERLETDT